MSKLSVINCRFPDIRAIFSDQFFLGKFPCPKRSVSGLHKKACGIFPSTLLRHTCQRKHSGSLTKKSQMRTPGTLNGDFISVILVECTINSLTDFDLNFFIFSSLPFF